MSLKKGYPIMIAGVGGAGKTELAFDIILNSSMTHKWRWLILSPETGVDDEILEVMIEKLSRGKTVEQGRENSMTAPEIEKIVHWLHRYYRILDPIKSWKPLMSDKPLTMENFFQAVAEEEKTLGGKFDGILIDPFNELDLELIGGGTSSIVKDELDALIRWSKKGDYCPILTNHVNDKREVQAKSDNGTVYHWVPPARKEDWAFGQQFGRKGYQMLLVYEWHKFEQQKQSLEGDLAAQHSIEQGYNMRDVFVQKSKPKGVGRTGKFRLFFNRQEQRYYEIDSLGNKLKIRYPW